MRYLREQGLRAVRLYEQYDRSVASVTDDLWYPSRGMLARWYRAWVEASCDDGSSLGDGRGNLLACYAPDPSTMRIRRRDPDDWLGMPPERMRPAYDIMWNRMRAASISV